MLHRRGFDEAHGIDRLEDPFGQRWRQGAKGAVHVRLGSHGRVEPGQMSSGAAERVAASVRRKVGRSRKLKWGRTPPPAPPRPAGCATWLRGKQREGYVCFEFVRRGLLLLCFALHGRVAVTVL